MKLKRVLLNNWLYYGHEMIQFDEINLLTGKTGQGKSAFLDALNIVLYGEVKSWNFNKAANDKSNRSVLSYLKGKYKDKGFLRDQGIFDTYIVLEFMNEDGSYFCQGIVFEVDGQSDHQRYSFFTLNHAIPEHEFIKEDGCAFTIKDMRNMIKERQDEKSKLFDRNEDYQDDLRLKFKLKDTRQFIKISKKALSYATIDKIDNFIVENICDFDRKVDIEQLLNEMRDYRELADLLRNMKDKKERLEHIYTLKQEYQEQNVKLLADRKEKQEKQFQRLLLEKQQLQKQIQQNEQKQESQKKTIVRLEEEKEEADKRWLEAYTSYQTSALSNLEERIKQTSEQKKQVEEEFQNALEVMQTTLQMMDDKITMMDEQMDASLFDQENINLIDIQLIIQKMRNHIKKQKVSLEDEEFDAFVANIAQLEDFLSTLRNEKRGNVQQIQQEMQESIQNIERYKQGIKNYPKELLMLKSTLEETLSKRHQQDIKLHILADVMEIKDPAWADAVEGFLGRRKYNLIVEPCYFKEAFQIYKQDVRLQRIYDYSIIDTASIEPRKAMDVSTLYDCVTCTNAQADAYVQYLLAGVVLCEKDENINAYPVSITKDCMLYQTYAVRRNHEKNWRKHYIGGNAIAALLAQEETHYQTCEETLHKEQKQEELLRKIQLEHSDVIKMKTTSYNKVCVRFTNVKESLAELEAQKAMLDNQEVQELKAALHRCKRVKEEAEEAFYNAKEELKQSGISLDDLHVKYANNQKAREDFIDMHASIMSFDETIEITCSFQDILQRINDLDTEIENLQKRCSRLENDMLNAKKDYNREFQLSLNENMDSDEFDREYSKYPGREILANEERFKEKERMARETFENSFLGSLKKRIDGTKSAIDDLNANISRIPFGHSKYRFKMEPKKEYEEIYKVIMSDELNGRSLWNTQAYEENQGILNDLFQQISEYSMSNDFYVREQLKARVENLSDYTTYLEFDITDNGESLKKSITDKSGGETQTPFYIAILASLMNCYREKNAEKLVLLDEAFDKMDSERIKECINLLRKLNFQAIVVTTNDKIINLGGIVDSVKVAKTKEIGGRRASTIMNFFKEIEQSE